MPLTAADFIQPTGDLHADMFPLTPEEREAGTTSLAKLTAHIDAWIAEATARTTEEAAQRAWVYHRAYRAVWLRLNTQPVSAGLEGQGQVKFSQEQIDAFGRLSEAYLVEYKQAAEQKSPAARFGIHMPERPAARQTEYEASRRQALDRTY